VPVFLTGIILISIFSVWLGWLPAFGRGEDGAHRILGGPGCSP
jgi:ABC-type dipeptide/oligopeptide/nickel transport system permease component